MNFELIHIVPFDMGISFLSYEDSQKQSKEEFVGLLRTECEAYKFAVIGGKKDVVCSVKINNDITCRLFSFGVGVFIIKNLGSEGTEKVDEAFGQFSVCGMYYKKKIEQEEILKGNSVIVQKLKLFMQTVWKVRKNRIRNFSSSFSYKYGGLSYVLTVYHIISGEEYLKGGGTEEINLLMNPTILKDIQDSDKWDNIRKRIKTYNCPNSNMEAYSDSTFVASSWSAVAVLAKERTEDIVSVVLYEAELQAVWFLFDAIINNLGNVEMKNVELQQQKSIASNAFLNISGVLNANMRSNEKRVFEKIYATSGIETMKEKGMMLLENRIALEAAKHSKRQNVYGIITEILLVSFTLIQLYSPIKNLIFGDVTRDDLIIGSIMVLILLFSSFLIIRKDR